MKLLACVRSSQLMVDMVLLTTCMCVCVTMKKGDDLMLYILQAFSDMTEQKSQFQSICEISNHLLYLEPIFNGNSIRDDVVVLKKKFQGVVQDLFAQLEIQVSGWKDENFFNFNLRDPFQVFCLFLIKNQNHNFFNELNHAISVIPPLLNTITLGGFTLKKKLYREITTTCFRNPQTNFGAHRSRCLGVRFATN